MSDNSDAMFRTLVERGADPGEASAFLTALEVARKEFQGRASEGVFQLMPSSFDDYVCNDTEGIWQGQWTVPTRSGDGA